jgi:uncharacterized protein YggL (DUF469 family)
MRKGGKEVKEKKMEKKRKRDWGPKERLKKKMHFSQIQDKFIFHFY